MKILLTEFNPEIPSPNQIPKDLELLTKKTPLRDKEEKGYNSYIYEPPLFIDIKHKMRFGEENAFTADIQYSHQNSEFYDFTKFFFHEILNYCNKGKKNTYQEFFLQAMDSFYSTNFHSSYSYLDKDKKKSYLYSLIWSLYIDSYNYNYIQQMEIVYQAMNIWIKTHNILYRIYMAYLKHITTSDFYSNKLKFQSEVFIDMIFEEMEKGNMIYFNFVKDFYKMSFSKLYFLVAYDLYFGNLIRKKGLNYTDTQKLQNLDKVIAKKYNRL